MYSFPAPQFSPAGYLGGFVSVSTLLEAVAESALTPEHFANVLLYMPVGGLGYAFFRS
jgi:hypothetical protein